MRYQPIFDIAELCVRKGLKDVVLCPGSRCAPLTLAFTRHNGLRTRTFSDERSGGFIGLGMAQQSRKPVILVCTSGTAAYNFAPAVAEAWFSNTPLIVFTADRPAEWIAQHDGQTIFQSELFGKHVKKSYTLPQDYDHADSVWAVNRIVNEAVNLAQQHPQGPVHINAPFREPLYPEKGEKTQYSQVVRVLTQSPGERKLNSESLAMIERDFAASKKVLVVVGQMPFEQAFNDLVCEVTSSFNIPLVADVISNISGEAVITHADLFLGQCKETLKKELEPELLITVGQSLISKNLKLFLRKHPGMRHWHVQPGGAVADTFKHMTDVFDCSEVAFFEYLKTFSRQAKHPAYTTLWLEQEALTKATLQSFLSKGQLTELHAVKSLVDKLPAGSSLHLANSMSVRYANFVGIDSPGVAVYANRGTSGIDGSTSTAVGHALASSALHVLVTGDVAFFYDRNAFWHNYPIPNLRILLLNNHGGLIFNMIDGPASQPEASEYFVTRQRLDARKLCEEFGFTRLTVTESGKSLERAIDKLLAADNQTKILEVETDLQVSRDTFDNLKQQIRNLYEL